MMTTMTPRQRVLVALNHGVPDHVPWVENALDEPLQVELMAGTEFTPGDLCRRLGMDGFGGTFPIAGRDRAGNPFKRAQGHLDSYYFPDRVNFDFFNTYITETVSDATPGRSFLSTRLLASEDSLSLFSEFQPDPNHPARYERIAEWLSRYREDFAVFARLDLGCGATIQSMGLEQLSYALFDNPGLIHNINRRFSDWSEQVIAHLNQMDFDFLWVMDDLAWNRTPFFSLEMFREFFLPYMKKVAHTIRKPWIFHSDGNILPFMDDLIELGMNAIHPIQPGAMDIGEIKKRYGRTLCLVGNIDLGYTLTRGTPTEVEAEVVERIRTAGVGGGYIVSSAMTLTDYCKTQNILAMAEAVRTHGSYEAPR
jgi:uroporphyrinogen decarboxylase